VKTFSFQLENRKFSIFERHVTNSQSEKKNFSFFPAPVVFYDKYSVRIIKLTENIINSIRPFESTYLKL